MPLAPIQDDSFLNNVLETLLSSGVDMPDEVGVAPANADAQAESVVLSENTGISHIKVGDRASATLVSADERTLQERLAQEFPDLLLDTTTPKDGHCLFHGLKRGGLCEGIPEALDIAALRGMAVNQATAEQLAVAAISQG